MLKQFSRMWVILVAILFACQMGAFAQEIPFEALWGGSGHGDSASEAFRHWDASNPPVVSTSCAKCHSTAGYRDFLGADGSAEGTIEVAPPGAENMGIECVACHNTQTTAMNSVIFPSGIEVAGLGSEARCMLCHQGRESTISVDVAIANANLPNEDTAGLGFKNVHYAAAGATQMGGQAMGGYQYAGKAYEGKFSHVKGLDSCVTCHDPHTLEVNVAACGACHEGVVAKEDLAGIRFMGSGEDYDGDGDIEEGIAGEIHGLKATLYSAIQANATALGAPIGFESHSYPYWFNDSDGNGTIEGAEAVSANGYRFTARLLKGAYNYQFAMKDPGAYAHNAKYLIQLLYDSIEDLAPTLLAGLHRNDAGHFDGTKEAFRHWDGGEGMVEGGCAKCHSATGLPFYLATGVNVAEPAANGLSCLTCHDSMDDFSRYAVDEVKFPSGAVLSFSEGEEDSNVCINCHQGRESTVSVMAAVEGVDAHTVMPGKRFINSHYYPAGATVFGTEAKGGYEFPGKTYNARRNHATNESLGTAIDSCVECHDSHTLKVNESACVYCHNKSPKNIRITSKAVDYDGDGKLTEGLYYEIQTLHDDLYDEMLVYAKNIVGVPLQYSTSYPYFYSDFNENGEVDEDELGKDGSFTKFTPELMGAAYNYQFFKKDPGAFAHNHIYTAQILYDSIEALGAGMGGRKRPVSVHTVQACGDPTHPKPAGDVSGDCRVDMADLAIVGGNWLLDANPQP